MRRVAKDLISANRAGSAQAFADAVNRHASVQAIGNYALGTYRPALKPAESTSYYNGMVKFIARYSATESQKYQVSHAEVLGRGQQTDKGILIDTRVHMRDGGSYDVQWLLQAAGGGYRVRDAKVNVLLGDYWLTPFLKDLFEKYIAENGGQVQSLVTALNR